MKTGTREKWAERIREWRASGLSAKQFASGKDYGASGLRWAVLQLEGRKKRGARVGSDSQPRSAHGQRRADSASSAPLVRAPRFMPVRVQRLEPVVTEMVVEVGGARIGVSRGVDIALLGDVVRALQGGGR